MLRVTLNKNRFKKLIIIPGKCVILFYTLLLLIKYGKGYKTKVAINSVSLFLAMEFREEM